MHEGEKEINTQLECFCHKNEQQEMQLRVSAIIKESLASSERGRCKARLFTGLCYFRPAVAVLGQNKKSPASNVIKLFSVVIMECHKC